MKQIFKGKFTLHSSILYENIKVFKKLLQRDKVNIDKQNDNKRTPLHFAASKGNYSAVRLLKMKEANPNIKDYHDNIPLHLAVKNNNLTIVKLLIEMGSNLDSKDRYGNTPLHLAASRGNICIVEELLAHGANPNTVNFVFMTALSIALKSQNYGVIKAIKEAGGKVPKTIKETIKLAYLSSNIFRRYGIALFSASIIGFAMYASLATKGELGLLLISAILSSFGLTIVCLERPYIRVRSLEARVFNSDAYSSEAKIEDLLFNQPTKNKHYLSDYMKKSGGLDPINDNDKLNKNNAALNLSRT